MKVLLGSSNYPEIYATHIVATSSHELSHNVEGARAKAISLQTHTLTTYASGR